MDRTRRKRHGVISTVPSRASLAWGPLEPSEPLTMTMTMTKLLQISDRDFPVLSLRHGLVARYLHEH